MVNPVPGGMPPNPMMPQIPVHAPASQQQGMSFIAVFYSGGGQAALKLDIVDGVNAAIAAFFLALRHYPAVHTFAVWKMIGPSPEDVEDPPIAYMNLVGLETEKSVKDAFASLLGKGAAPAPVAPGSPPAILPPAPVQLQTPGQGFDAMAKEMREKAGRGGARK